MSKGLQIKTECEKRGIPISDDHIASNVRDSRQLFPTFVQKSYFMLGERERDVFNKALKKYRAGRSEPILIGGANALKPADSDKIFALRNIFWFSGLVESLRLPPIEASS